MKITIDFGHPYFEENVLLGLTPDDLNCFYGDASEVDRLNLFFVLEASLHRFQGERTHENRCLLCVFDGVLSFLSH